MRATHGLGNRHVIFSPGEGVVGEGIESCDGITKVSGREIDTTFLLSEDNRLISAVLYSDCSFFSLLFDLFDESMIIHNPKTRVPGGSCRALRARFANRREMIVRSGRAVLSLKKLRVAMLVVHYLICLSLVVLAPPSAFAQVPDIIDTHSHIQSGGQRRTDFRGSLDAALHRMDQYGIHRMIIMPPPMVTETLAAYDIESYGFATEAYAGRILLGGGGGSLNVMIQASAADMVTDDIMKAFRTRAEQIVAAGAVVFGEIALHHMSLRNAGPHHPYESTPPDHPLLMLLADIAAEKNIPMDLHLDLVPEDMKLPDQPVFNPTNPTLLKANMAAFERLLAHNRAARIVWAHTGSDPLGTRTPQIQRELLSRNSNLFMSLRLSGAAPAPFFALGPNKNLKPIWLALFRDYPDRFVIGTDFFHAPPAGFHIGAAEEILQNYRATLAQMPPGLAIAIAHGNAEKIYRLGEH
jgi:hypothetical protein